MSRTSHLSLAALTLATLVASSASAQVIAYDHRSTVFGDHAAGYSELVRARGAFLKDAALAAEIQTRVIAAEDQITYQRAEYRYQTKQMELQYRQQRLNDKLARRETTAANQRAAAYRLWQNAQDGIVRWPVALERPEYSASMQLVESILHGWSPEDMADKSYRKALATELGVLRNRVTNDKSIAHSSRVQAVRTIKQLQSLTESDGQLEGAVQALAMK